MRTPRDYTALRNPQANASNPPQENQQKKSQSRPASPGWNGAGDMVSENAAANKYNAQANAHIAQRSQQAPGQASGKAAVRAAIQKARDTQPAQQGQQQPSRGTGRGR